MAGGLIASGWHSAALMMRINCDEVLPALERAGVARDRVDRLAEAGQAGRPAERAPHDAQRARVALAPRHRRRRGAVRADEPEPRSGDAAAGVGVLRPPPRAARRGDDRLYYEDHEVGQTAPLGAHRFTREAILDFARKFDPQPFHLDEAAAAKSIFGGLCASGWHTVSVSMRLLVDGRRAQRKAAGDARREAAAARPRQGRARSALVGAGEAGRRDRILVAGRIVARDPTAGLGPDRHAHRRRQSGRARGLRLYADGTGGAAVGLRPRRARRFRRRARSAPPNRWRRGGAG